MDLTWELAGSAARGAAGAVDTVVLQYANELFTREDANCTLWGVSWAIALSWTCSSKPPATPTAPGGW